MEIRSKAVVKAEKMLHEYRMKRFIREYPEFWSMWNEHTIEEEWIKERTLSD